MAEASSAGCLPWPPPVSCWRASPWSPARPAPNRSLSTARIDWSMPDRVIQLVLGAGQCAPRPADPRLPPAAGRVPGQAHRLRLAQSRTYRRPVQLEDHAARGAEGGDEHRCQLDFAFPEEGSFLVELTVVDIHGHTATTTRPVVVNDILIVSMGDSLASGEGNPDFPADSVPAPRGLAQDTRCHRSGLSGPAQAASCGWRRPTRTPR